MSVLYFVLGYLAVATMFSLFMEYKQKTWVDSNERIQAILDRGREGIANYAREGIEEGLGEDWDEDVPSELIDHTREQLLNKRNLQKQKIHSGQAILLTALTWPLVIVLYFYIMIFYTPKKGETYEEWARRIEEEKK